MDPTTVHAVKSIQAPDHFRQDGQGGHRSARARMDQCSQQLLHTCVSDDTPQKRERCPSCQQEGST